MQRSVHLAHRTQQTVPFHAVELFKTAQALSQAGHDIISLGIGEPDFTAPRPVVEALQQAAEQGLTQFGISVRREGVRDGWGAGAKSGSHLAKEITR